MNQNAYFSGFSPVGQRRIVNALTVEQKEKLDNLITLKWVVTRVYFSLDETRCAIVVKQPGAVGILYPYGRLHQPGGQTKTIMLDRDLLDKNNTVEKTVA